MRFVCESCRAQYMINDDKVGPKGVKVRCRKCGYVITVKRAENGAMRGASATNEEESAQTQVMQQPPEAEGPENGDLTVPAVDGASAGAAAPADDGIGPNFLGADEDEIGAVFDQVLKTGPVQKDRLDEVLAAQGDDRQSTRVIDADTVAALAKESQVSEPKLEAVPDGNWFVAINEKQTGPLALEKIKEHWDRGEIGPDSLCWREGFSDWVPLSEVKSLAQVLAPKPPKPIVVPAATIPTGAPAVVSVPVQSAFSAGGVMQTVQAEVQVPIAASAASANVAHEESGVWKPSAASALASLVKEEMEALAKPPPKAEPPPVEESPSRGLLDLPKETPSMAIPPSPVPSARTETRPTTAPVNPYLANPGATYSTPGISQYRPQSNRGLIIGIAAVVAVLVLSLIGLVLYVVNRQPTVIAQPPLAVAPTTPTPTPPTPPAPTPPTPVAALAAPTQPAATAAAANPPAQPAQPAPGPGPGPQAVAAKDPTPPSPPAVPPSQPDRAVQPPPVQPRPPRERRVVAESAPAERVEKEPKAAAKSPAKEEKEKDWLDDPAPAKQEKKAVAAPAEEKHSGGGYVPPAPGGGDVKEQLSKADVLEVVVANKGSLAKCAEEQKKRDPTTSGKLVMRFQVQTSGKASNVTVASEEFRGTYIAGCVGGLIKQMTFPKSKVQGDVSEVPIKF